MGKFQTFEQFVELFPQEPRSKIRGGFNVLCPTHNDNRPSLSATKANSKILLYCQAGCKTQDILQKLGLLESDLFLDNNAPRRIVAIYPYQDADGKVVYETVRYEPKHFKMRRPDGKGDYVWNLDGVKTILYHLPDIVRAKEYGDTIYLVEGEKDADNLMKLGLVATTNPMGAGKWQEDYTRTLEGANIRLVPQTDKAGIEHGLMVIKELDDKVANLQVVDWPETVKDVGEWLALGNDLESLDKFLIPPLAYTKKYTSFLYTTEKQNLPAKRDNFGITSGQDWGIYAKKFDEFMREARGSVDKRDIAETIGLKATDDTFRKLLARRKEEGKVRTYRGSPYLIEWINRDYEVTRLDKVKADPMLDISLPLRIHEYACVPPGSVIGIAGMTSSGKTSFLLETAELNVLTQPMSVYYWYNEMSEAKMIYRCEDFPLLLQAQKAGKFFPVKQGNFEFADVLQPDAINLVDYLDRDQDLYLIGGDIKKLYSVLNNGVVIFALQKKAHLDLGYGGNMSIKLSNLYVTLDIRYQSGQSMHGIAKIVKSKDWRNIATNPNSLCCEYHTGGKHGKLFIDSDWKPK